MWDVVFDGKVVKSYPYRIQACVYCWMEGWVYSGYDDWERNSIGEINVLHPQAKIVERD